MKEGEPEQLTLQLRAKRGRPKKPRYRVKPPVERIPIRGEDGNVVKHPGYHHNSVKLERNRARVQKELRAFYDSTPLPKLKKAIELTDNPKLRMLYAALNNPALYNSSFADLCRRCKVTIVDLVGAWRHFHIAEGMANAIHHVPQVMEDVAVDALTRVIKCPDCEGDGKVANTSPKRMPDYICRTCHGDGIVRIKGDDNARKLLFETMGLTGKDARVVQNQSITINQPPPSLEDSIRDTEKAIDITPINPNSSGDEDVSAIFDGDQTDSKEPATPGGAVGEGAEA